MEDQPVSNEEMLTFPANSEPNPLSSNSCSTDTIDCKHENNASITHEPVNKGRRPPPEIVDWWKTNGFSR